MKTNKFTQSMYRCFASGLFMVSGLMAVNILAADESVPFIEEGKTWWYEVGEDDWWDGTQVWTVVVGITLQGETELDGKTWKECRMVDTDGIPVTDYPLALLREEDNKIYVTARDLNLSYEEWEEKVTADCDPAYAYVILLYASFTHHQDEEYGYASDPITDYPALLYDFSWQEGDVFSWPWAWRCRDNDTREWCPNEIRIEGTGIDDRQPGSPSYWDFTVLEPDGREGSKFGRIVAGVGAVDVENIYTGTDIFNNGFFFNPGQTLPPMESGFNTPTRRPPFLTVVKRPDGTVIYRNEQSAVNVPLLESNKMSDPLIYDLHGRPVTTPVSGSIYIRDGKKFVAK